MLMLWAKADIEFSRPGVCEPDVSVISTLIGQPVTTTDRPTRHVQHWMKPKRAVDLTRDHSSNARRTSSRPWLRWVGYGVLAVVAALAFAWWIGWIGGEAKPEAQGSSSSAAPAKPTNVVSLKPEAMKTLAFKTVKPTLEPIVEHVGVTGQILFDERRVAHLRPLSQSRIMKVDAQPGQQVKKGAVLMVMDAIGLTDARAKLVDAQARLKQAQVAADTANRNVDRGNVLVKDQTIPQIQQDSRISTAAAANAAVDTAKADVKLQEIQVEREDPAHATGRDSNIVSPFDGMVLSVSSGPGDVVDDNFVVAMVANPSVMVAQIHLYEDQLRQVHAGDMAHVTSTAYPGRSFEGKLVSVAAELDQKSNTASARIEIPNPDGALKSGMFVSADVSVDQGRRGLNIPTAAVQTIDDKPVAFVKTGPERFERRDLVLGLVTAESEEVKSGIAAGDEVVTQGSFDLKAIVLKSLLGSTD